MPVILHKLAKLKPKLPLIIIKIDYDLKKTLGILYSFLIMCTNK